MTDYRLWWLKSNNFGDIITPAIFDYFNIKYDSVDSHYDANIISTGSIARRAEPNTIVLGSGIISMIDKVHPTADWRFVRGPLTREKIISSGGECPRLFLDPGLLLPKMVRREKTIFDLGYIPHFSEYEHISSIYDNVINLKNPNINEVIKSITSCKKTISSSLHGIICSHAYGIPSAWVSPISPLKGDNIKFYDYFLSVGIIPTISTYDNPKYTLPKKIPNIENILEIFESLKN